MKNDELRMKNSVGTPSDATRQFFILNFIKARLRALNSYLTY